MSYHRLANWIRDRLVFAYVLAGCIWAVWIGSVILGGGTFDAIGLLFAGDHIAFYTPARLILEGKPGELYHYEFTSQYQQALFPGKYNSANLFRNPPFYALLYVPTAKLPYAVSAGFWNVVGLAGLVLGIRWLGVDRPWRVTVWALAFLPVYTVMSYGQNSLLSFAVFAGCYRLLADGRPFRAGLVAGLLCFKPTLLIGLVVWGLLDIRRLWPAALGVVVTAVVLVAGSYAIVPEAWDAYLRNLRDLAAYNGFDQWKAHTVWVFWHLLLPDFPRTVQVLTWIVTLLGLVEFYRVWRVRGGELPVMFGAAVAITLWATPHAMIYEWSLAVIPAALWWHADRQHRDVWLVIFTVVWATFLTGTDVSRGLDWFQREILDWQTVYLFQYTIPVVGWAGWKASRLLRDPKPAMETEPTPARKP